MSKEEVVNKKGSVKSSMKTMGKIKEPIICKVNIKLLMKKS